MKDICEQILDLQERGEAGVLATLVERSGSGSRPVGAKMLILNSGGTVGSLGGGAIEAEVVRCGAEVLESGEPRLVTISPQSGEEDRCGGRAVVFLEPILSGKNLIIFGAGHVGRAVAGMAILAGFQVTLVDDREEMSGSREGVGARFLQRSVEHFFVDINVTSKTYLLICTRSHSMDLEVLRQALRTPAEFIGLLGSRRKRENFFSILCREGAARDDLERVVCPVGLAIGAVTPEEIGVAVVAQLIERYRKGISSAGTFVQDAQ
ncbi:XdhC family protein [Desulfolithobacter sp.]